eukprot:5563803-Pleurochrysis_carterae.AAC.1
MPAHTHPPSPICTCYGKHYLSLRMQLSSLRLLLLRCCSGFVAFSVCSSRFGTFFTVRLRISDTFTANLKTSACMRSLELVVLSRSVLQARAALGFSQMSAESATT